MTMKKLNLKVKGMTCSSCEVLIERNLKKVPGVERVKVSRAREQAEVECADAVQLQQLQEAVKEKGYTLYASNDPIENPPKSSFMLKDKERLSEIGAVLVVIIGAYILLRQFDLFPKSLGVTDNMSYGFIFLIGLVAATSTCLAVAGGLLLAVAGKFNEKYPHLTGWQKFKPHMSFNIGRIFSYTLLGGLIGLFGSVLTISPKVTGIITILASALMIILGLQMLHLFPWLNKIQLKMPKLIAHKLYDASHQEQRSTSNATSFLFGASTFFLPCGFTLALQLYVLGKGDFVTGALTMLVFSLGTLPSLAGIGAFSSFAKGNVLRHVMTFSAVLVIILGLFNMPNGLALTGASISLESNAPSQLAEDTNIIGGKQIVSMAVNSLDYVPSRFTIVEGIPVEWHIDGTRAEGCAQVISVPSLGITEFLPRDKEKVITFTPQETDTIKFSCSMGMAGPGVFTVVPNTQGIKGAELKDETIEQPSQPAVTGEVQKLNMEISRERGFYPNSFTVKKGIPVELEFDTKLQLGGCMGTLVIPKYNVAHVLSLGKSTLRFTPTKEGTVPFTCSMGSKMGEFRVVA